MFFLILKILILLITIVFPDYNATICGAGQYVGMKLMIFSICVLINGQLLCEQQRSTIHAMEKMDTEQRSEEFRAIRRVSTAVARRASARVLTQHRAVSRAQQGVQRRGGSVRANGTVTVRCSDVVR